MGVKYRCLQCKRQFAGSGQLSSPFPPPLVITFGTASRRLGDVALSVIWHKMSVTVKEVLVSVK